MRAVRRALLALRSAAATPLAIRDGLAPLLDAPPRGSLPAPWPAPTRAEAAAAVAIGGRALRVLARIPRGEWRTTCLYRSVTECLTLRAMGIPAVLCLGVRSAPDGARETIMAHAWVECSGLGITPDAARYTVLRPSALGES